MSINSNYNPFVKVTNNLNAYTGSNMNPSYNTQGLGNTIFSSQAYSQGGYDQYCYQPPQYGQNQGQYGYDNYIHYPPQYDQNQGQCGYDDYPPQYDQPQERQKPAYDLENSAAKYITKAFEWLKNMFTILDSFDGKTDGKAEAGVLDKILCNSTLTKDDKKMINYIKENKLLNAVLSPEESDCQKNVFTKDSIKIAIENETDYKTDN